MHWMPVCHPYTPNWRYREPFQSLFWRRCLGCCSSVSLTEADASRTHPHQVSRHLVVLYGSIITLITEASLQEEFPSFIIGWSAYSGLCVSPRMGCFASTPLDTNSGGQKYATPQEGTGVDGRPFPGVFGKGRAREVRDRIYKYTGTLTCQRNPLFSRE